MVEVEVEDRHIHETQIIHSRLCVIRVPLHQNIGRTLKGFHSKLICFIPNETYTSLKVLWLIGKPI
ncbi:hypothetical protein Lal_00026797 [Lupinus albus]|nr:hypothetical protein Lal_00026797 [Lupinus albus]